MSTETKSLLTHSPLVPDMDSSSPSTPRTREHLTETTTSKETETDNRNEVEGVTASEIYGGEFYRKCLECDIT